MSFMYAYNPKYCDGDYCSKDCDHCRRWEKSRAWRFRAAREGIGLSQREVEAKTGISKSSITNLENDFYEVLDPRFHTVLTLAKLYGEDPVYLMTGREKL